MSEQTPNMPKGGKTEAVQSAETNKQPTAEQAAMLGNKIIEMMQERDINPDADVTEIGISNWQMMSKGPDGKPVTHDLTSTRVKLKLNQVAQQGKSIEELIINRAAPTVINPSKGRARPTSDRSALIVPDQQIGFRKDRHGNWIAIHDDKAMEISQQIAKDTQPDEIIILGDNVDLPNMSRFESDPNFTQSTQMSIDRLHRELAQYRSNAPNAKIKVIAGNHDERWVINIRKNAAELLGIRRANVARELSVLSLEYLLRMDELEIDYLPGYPANRYWLNNNLKAIHGHVIRSGGSTAAAVANSETTSTLFGHIHRIESHHRTVNEAGGGRVISAHSFGTLSRIDGAVPSYGYGRDEDGQPIEHYENWQQGLGFVLYKPEDGPHDVQTINIKTFDGYRTNWNGRVYQPLPPLRSVPDAA